jgi:hypothetical protein
LNTATVGWRPACRLVVVAISALASCGGEEVVLRCVDEELPTSIWFQFRFGGSAERTAVESYLGGVIGDMGALRITDSQYRISVPFPDGSGSSEFTVDRASGTGAMLSLDPSGQFMEGTVILALDCQRMEAPVMGSRL